MGHTILIVEDAFDTQQILKFTLEREGFDVLVANQGAEALRILEKHKPDLILADLAMPQMDGLEFLRWVKSTEKLVGIPIVVLSAYSDGWMDRAVEEGATVVLRKPNDLFDVGDRIRRVLGRASP